MKPRISIVIPCFNYGHYLEDAIDSCLKSTFLDIEIIVVNNGSTDSYTNEVIHHLNTPRTCVVHIERNQGLPHGRNRGIAEANGDYILPLDADDMIHPTLLEKTCRILDNNPEVGFVTSGFQRFGDNYNIWMPPPFDFNTLLKTNIVCVTSLFRKQAWREVGGYNEKMLDGYEDWDFWISIADKGWLGDTIQEPLLYYRRHGRNMSNDSSKKHSFLIKQMQNNHPHLYPNR